MQQHILLPVIEMGETGKGIAELFLNFLLIAQVFIQALNGLAVISRKRLKLAVEMHRGMAMTALRAS